jgi:hypothetical protein
LVLAGSEMGPVTAAYEDGMELWVPQQAGDFFGQMIAYEIFKKGCFMALDNGYLK